MPWAPIEREWLGEQLLAVLPRPELEAALEEGVPALLDAMPASRRWGLRALVWWVALTCRSGPAAAVLRRWRTSDSWIRREVVTSLMLLAALVWEADGGPDAVGWGEGAPVVLPERRSRLVMAPTTTFAPEEIE